MQPGERNQQPRDADRDDVPPWGNTRTSGPAGAPFGTAQRDPFRPSVDDLGGPYGAPGGPGGPAPYGPVGSVEQLRRGRPGLIVLISFLVQLVLVAAVGNQWVGEKLIDFRNDHSGLAGLLATTPLTYAWRFTPRDGQTDLWGAQLIGLGAGFALAALLTLAVVRGPITFGRAFFGVWMSVLVATLLGGMTFRAVVDSKYVGNLGFGNGAEGRVANVLFRSGGSEVVAALALGVIAALIAALVAVVSRRQVPVAPLGPPPVPQDSGPEPEAPPPYYGEPAAAAAAPRPGEPEPRTMSMQKVQDSVHGEPDRSADSNYRRPAPDAGDDKAANAATAAFPVAGAAAATPAEQRTESPAEPESTQAMPAAGADTSGAATSGEASDERATRAIPVQGAGNPDEQTVRRGSLPPGAFDPPAQQPSQESGQRTSAFPRPPDDEDLDQNPDHHRD